MPPLESTCWNLIEMAASGDVAQRAEFVHRYNPIVVDYLAARWRGTPLIDEVDDTADEVFLECFRHRGALGRADPSRPGGFRAFFFGVIRNVSRRVEDARARNRELQQSTSYDPDDREMTLDTSASRVLDRTWARAVISHAVARHSREAESQDDAAIRRVEILRLRFEDNLPIREIASRWNMDALKLHREYRRARREFRRCLETELAFEGELSRDHKRQWQEFLALLR